MQIDRETTEAAGTVPRGLNNLVRILYGRDACSEDAQGWRRNMLERHAAKTIENLRADCTTMLRERPAPPEPPAGMAEMADSLARDVAGLLGRTYSTAEHADIQGAVREAVERSPQIASLRAERDDLLHRAIAAEAEQKDLESQLASARARFMDLQADLNREEDRVAALEVEREVSEEWRPVETAPKDGTVIWLAWSDGPKLWHVNKCKWSAGKQFPWRILDGQREDGLGDEPDLLWQPFYELPKRPEPPRTLISAQKDRSDG